MPKTSIPATAEGMPSFNLEGTANMKNYTDPTNRISIPGTDDMPKAAAMTDGRLGRLFEALDLMDCYNPTGDERIDNILSAYTALFHEYPIPAVDAAQAAAPRGIRLWCRGIARAIVDAFGAARSALGFGSRFVAPKLSKEFWDSFVSAHNIAHVLGDMVRRHKAGEPVDLQDLVFEAGLLAHEVRTASMWAEWSLANSGGPALREVAGDTRRGRAKVLRQRWEAI